MGNEFAAVQAVWLREFKVFQREKSRVVSSVVSPLFWLVLFGAGLGGFVEGLPAGLTYTAFIFPGLLFMTVLFSSMFFGMYIVWDRKLDFLKEVLAAPVSRPSIFLGKVLGGTTDALAQSLLLILLGALVLPFLSPGFPGLSPVGMLLSLPVIFLIAVSIASLGLGIGTMFESFEGFQVVVSFVIFPLFFLSGALYPLTGLPSWLTVVTTVNPLSYAVDLLRYLLLGAGTVNPLFSFGMLVGFTALMLGFGTFMFQRMK
ncbi:MAG TPA: ABC transporter permease [Candidatus Thermoplasmatota archaeon]|jgi:ABC-2 type transport system permease protein|nr:ABC transporter permease [Candidatus Thermoplasmatota archaeon]